MKWVGAIFLLFGIVIIGALFAGYSIRVTPISGVNTFPQPQLVSLVFGGALILIGAVWIFKG